MAERRLIVTSRRASHLPAVRPVLPREQRERRKRADHGPVGRNHAEASEIVKQRMTVGGGCRAQGRNGRRINWPGWHGQLRHRASRVAVRPSHPKQSNCVFDTRFTFTDKLKRLQSRVVVSNNVRKGVAPSCARRRCRYSRSTRLGLTASQMGRLCTIWCPDRHSTAYDCVRRQLPRSLVFPQTNCATSACRSRTLSAAAVHVAWSTSFFTAVLTTMR